MAAANPLNLTVRLTAVRFDSSPKGGARNQGRENKDDHNYL